MLVVVVKQIDVVGVIVLVSEEDKKRSQWKVGVVENLIRSRGRDQQVRGAHLRVVTKGKRLYPIEVKSKETVVNHHERTRITNTPV